MGSIGHISSSSRLFDDWVGRSLADIVMMTSETADGPYPYAGVPWFSTVFGRDGIVTASSCCGSSPRSPAAS